MTCLKRHHLIEHSDREHEINTKHSMNENKCRTTHNDYVTCMGSNNNQGTLLHNAALHSNCHDFCVELMNCFSTNRELETQTSEPQCIPFYRRLLRCGLHHLWNNYWCALTKFGEAE
ncbi:hypothetical protein TraAM80_03211 [Trypanosoma rangeli]|uniref:Uncharacterized protein n=1 Tax=Trypanosoma rangeli TaxID=5698 RepID=A0A3R7NK51_TRYRA|nr:uncharacterized protein TraAM80_03211 [Trypanosoma rangeli]RNF07689.1 hypothetical protein TraAM80_03211 [Trypanosoma rangeli]|eukprot:RNF07689.1 hypothetical protein TraAM80_03211 [Trypanosoma rangeli]